MSDTANQAASQGRMARHRVEVDVGDVLAWGLHGLGWGLRVSESWVVCVVVCGGKASVRLARDEMGCSALPWPALETVWMG